MQDNVHACTGLHGQTECEIRQQRLWRVRAVHRLGLAAEACCALGHRSGVVLWGAWRSATHARLGAQSTHWILRKVERLCAPAVLWRCCMELSAPCMFARLTISTPPPGRGVRSKLEGVVMPASSYEAPRYQPF